jgi:3,4-dihydroxy 2-butanone 4-phosphate synthase/GTP cyclohydrolase II
MGDGPSCPIGGPTAVLAWHGQALANGQLEQLQRWALKQGLQVEREEHPRLLALLDQPQLAVLLGCPDGRLLSAADLAASLQQLMQQEGSQRLSLLLAPDAQRLTHPSATLEPEFRDLKDLSPGENESCPLLRVQPGAFVVWRAA